MKLMLTLIAVVILNGCASQPQHAASAPPKSKTIVMPGCLPIGKELHCQWIDPPHAEEPARVNGIAL